MRAVKALAVVALPIWEPHPPTFQKKWTSLEKNIFIFSNKLLLIIKLKINQIFWNTKHLFSYKPVMPQGAKKNTTNVDQFPEKQMWISGVVLQYFVLYYLKYFVLYCLINTTDLELIQLIWPAARGRRYDDMIGLEVWHIPYSFRDVLGLLLAQA